MLRKTSVAAAVIAFATAGSALFGGAVLADDTFTNTGGAGGAGGQAQAQCLIPIGVSAGLIAAAGGPVSQCNAFGGAGGAGGAGLLGG